MNEYYGKLQGDNVSEKIIDYETIWLYPFGTEVKISGRKYLDYLDDTIIFYKRDNEGCHCIDKFGTTVMSESMFTSGDDISINVPDVSVLVENYINALYLDTLNCVRNVTEFRNDIDENIEIVKIMRDLQNDIENEE